MSAALAAPVTTTILMPGDPGWDDARRAWNLAVDQLPAAIALPESAHDVAVAIRFARDHGLRVAAQGTGHNARPLGSLDDTVLVKTTRMRQVTIDPVARIARAEAGAVWHEVIEAAAEHGLAALAGSSPDVGVVGYTIGGGISWLGRSYGLAANNVEAIEVVTADGRLVRADACTEPDLFWALRGGGGSFGVVTAIELRLFPITEVYAGLRCCGSSSESGLHPTLLASGCRAWCCSGSPGAHHRPGCGGPSSWPGPSHFPALGGAGHDELRDVHRYRQRPGAGRAAGQGQAETRGPAAGRAGPGGDPGRRRPAAVSCLPPHWRWRPGSWPPSRTAGRPAGRRQDRSTPHRRRAGTARA